MSVSQAQFIHLKTGEMSDYGWECSSKFFFLLLGGYFIQVGCSFHEVALNLSLITLYHVPNLKQLVKNKKHIRIPLQWKAVSPVFTNFCHPLSFIFKKLCCTLSVLNHLA